jgi:hypothetical protein
MTYAPFIQAAAQGQVIQHRLNSGPVTGEWENMSPLDKFDEHHEYRIKTEPVLKPYFEEHHFALLVGRVVKSKTVKVYKQILETRKDKKGSWQIVLSGGSTIPPATLLNGYMLVTDISDTEIVTEPCGVYVDEIFYPNQKAKGTPDDDEDVEDYIGNEDEDESEEEDV